MKQESIKVVIVEPNKEPRVEIIKNDLETLQGLVGGYIECVKQRGFDIIINEEGKLLELESNFVLFSREHCEYIVGTAVFAGVDTAEGEFKSLSETQIQRTLEVFKGRN